MQTATNNGNGSLQKNINTVLLFLITTGIAWAIKSIDNLDQRMIRLETSTSIYNDANSKTQQDVNRDGINISNLQLRISNLELLSQRKK